MLWLLYFQLKLLVKLSGPNSERAPRSDHQISEEQCLCLFVYQMFTAVVVIPQGLISISQTNTCRMIKCYYAHSQPTGLDCCPRQTAA